MSQSGTFENRIFPPGSILKTITGNDGIPVGPDALDNITIDGAHGINTTGNPLAHTITAAINNTILLGDLSVVAPYTDALGVVTGDISIYAGSLNLPATNNVNSQGIIRFDGNRWISEYGIHNTFVGQSSGNATLTVATSRDNTAVGGDSGAMLTTGDSNCFYGYRSGASNTTGSRNVFIGLLAGGNSTSSSNCVFIGSLAGALATGGSTDAVGIGVNALYNLTTGNANIAIGYQTLSHVTSGSGCTAVGSLAAVFVLGDANNAFGTAALSSCTTGEDNVAIGSYSCSDNVNGSKNIVIGNSALPSATAPSNNIVIGHRAANNYITNESSNIIIGNVGVAAEDNKIRIGTTGNGAGQQNNCYIAGIQGVDVGSVATVVSHSGDHLGSTTMTAGTGVSVTSGASTITIATSGTTTLNWTNVDTTPYPVLATDQYLSVDCSLSPITLLFPDSAALGRTYIVKDRTGSADINTITVTTVSGITTIDGSAINTIASADRVSIQLMGNGTGYEIY